MGCTLPCEVVASIMHWDFSLHKLRLWRGKGSIHIFSTQKIPPKTGPEDWKAGVKPKVVRHHANTENPDRCFVRLFKLYTSLCPADAPKDVFYLKPLMKPTPTWWYSNQPVGHNKLSQTVSQLCKQAGIHSYKTNHSLRVTTATRLYASGVDEQLVMERTGHRSLDGVRTYKRTSNEQQVAISDVLNRVKRSRVESPPNTQTISTPTMPGPLAVPPQATQAPVTQFAQTSTIATIPGHFHFNSCSSVTINFNCNTN